VNSATGASAALIVLAVLAALIVLGRAAGHLAGRQDASPPGPEAEELEEPESRPHEPGGCWCGDLHEGIPAAGGTSWAMS